MKINIIQVPYHLGQEEVGMGLGPIHFLEAGLVDHLKNQKYEIKIDRIHLSDQIQGEIPRIIETNVILKNKVKQAMKNEFFPFILGGNCNVCLGTIAGMTTTRTGVLWFDAHGDFNTPEITPSGFFDGMPLAIVMGKCYNNIWMQIDGQVARIKESNTLHLGFRDLDPPEQELLESTDITIIGSKQLKEKGIKKQINQIFDTLNKKVDGIYLHIDIDVIDPLEAPGVDYRSPDGLSCDEMVKLIALIGKQLRIKAAALTAYNPKNDYDNKTLSVGIKIIDAISNVAILR